jgi:Protein of unknown function (DUF1176)
MFKGLAIAAALFVFAGAAQAAGTKTVSDWTGVCSNLGNCAAFGFSEEDADTAAYLRVDRAAGPGAAPSVLIAFDPGDKQPSATWTLELDGRPVAGVGPVRAIGGDGGARARLSGPGALALIEALRNGKTLAILAAGKPVATVSLTGSAAVLLWVDDQRGRVGTVTALARPGSKPASAVPPAPATPLVVAAPAVSQAGLPKLVPKSLIKGDADCDLTGVDTPDDIVARLAPGVVLWGPECQMLAYNEVSVFFLGDEQAGHLKPITFPEAPGAEQASDDELINASFDPKTRTLSMFAKGRGIGDCGETASWVWDGKSFQLLSEFDMPECRGASPDDWTALYEARTK